PPLSSRGTATRPLPSSASSSRCPRTRSRWPSGRFTATSCVPISSVRRRRSSGSVAFSLPSWRIQGSKRARTATGFASPSASAGSNRPGPMPEGKNEKQLLRGYHERGDTQAREQLIEQYLPLVRSLARPYSSPGQQLEDL